jgi:hypothetical protein
MAETRGVEIAITSKQNLMRALVDSGLSYEQPPEADVDRLWEAMRGHANIVLVEVKENP